MSWLVSLAAKYYTFRSPNSLEELPRCLRVRHCSPFSFMTTMLLLVVRGLVDKRLPDYF